VQIDGLQRHWDRATVEADIAGDNEVKVRTSNVTALTLDMPSGHCPLDPARTPSVLLDGQQLVAARVETDRSWTAHFRKEGGKWAVWVSPEAENLTKRHGLQGPIDDAFWDRFVMVRPTGKPMNEKVGKWTNAEMKHAVEHWRRQFRGEAIVKDDDDISDADIASSNLVLWGDSSSNKVLAKIADRLPIRWDAKGIVAGKSYDPEHHVLLMICPNPLNPKKYVVLNSGFTFREYDYLNNARQVPKLPDFAVVDVNSPVTSQTPGGVVVADFFDEGWKLRGEKR
jgi:hypothetical protein